MMFYLIAVAIVVLDQGTKELIVRNLHLGQSIPILHNFFAIALVLNPGAAFGFLATLPDWVRNPLFIAISIVAVGLIAFYQARYVRQFGLVTVALALILGGAVGNLIDRLRYGMVVDFLDVHVYQYHWPAFNVADSAISVGVCLMLVDMLREWRRGR